MAPMRVSLRKKRRNPAAKVFPMPKGGGSPVAQFLRFHVLVRVHGGDPDAWLARLRDDAANGIAVDDADVRFVRWIRSRLRRDPALLATIRTMVDATPFWRTAEA